MVKMKILMVVGAMIIAGTIFYSCQKENSPNVSNTEMNGQKVVVDACVSTFDAGNALPVYTNTTFNIAITAWNDATTTYVTLTRTGGNMTVRAASPGVALTQTNGGTILDAGTTVTYLVANPPNWSCSNLVTFSFYVSGLGGGSENEFQTGIIYYNLTGLCTTTTLEASAPNNVCVGEEVVLTASVTASETVGTGTLIIKESVNGSWVDYPYTTVTPEVAGTRTFMAEYNGNETGHFCSSGSTTLEIIAEVCYGCVESFTYVDNGGPIYTFTYVPAEDMTDVLVVFTFAQATAIDGFDATWNNKGQTMQKSMDFVACETYVWVITLVKDCNGNTPNNNVWTDFKVDGSSKKGSLSNITQPCPED